MKPNVILPGEQLSMQAMLAAKQAIRHADILLIAGTSLAGGPATTLIDTAYLQNSRLIIVNQTPTLMDASAEAVIYMDVAAALPAIADILREERKR